MLALRGTSSGFLENWKLVPNHASNHQTWCSTSATCSVLLSNPPLSIVATTSVNDSIDQSQSPIAQPNAQTGYNLNQLPPARIHSTIVKVLRHLEKSDCSNSLEPGTVGFNYRNLWIKKSV